MKIIGFKKFVLKQEEKEQLYEFANLDYIDTGIKDIVIHCYSQGDTKIQHGARVKVSNVRGKYSKADTFSVEVKTGKVVEGECKLSAKELKMIKLWIVLNKQEIVDYWNSEGQMITRQFYNSIRRIDE